MKENAQQVMTEVAQKVEWSLKAIAVAFGLIVVELAIIIVLILCA
jgi:hypothetical protein